MKIMKPAAFLVTFLLLMSHFAYAAWVECDAKNSGVKEAIGNNVFQCVNADGDYRWARLTATTTLPQTMIKTGYFQDVFARVFAIVSGVLDVGYCG